MTVLDDFVVAELTASVNTTDTTIRVTHASPYRRFPDPGGATAWAVLTDDAEAPTKFEIVSYTGATTIDSSTTDLTGVSRGQGGTSPENFNTGARIAQDVLAEHLDLLELAEPLHDVYVASIDTSIRRVGLDLTVRWTASGFGNDLEDISVYDDGSVVGCSVDGLVIKYDADGNELWRFTGHGSSPVHSIAATVDGGAFTLSNYASGDGTVRKIDASGNEVWQRSDTFSGSAKALRWVRADENGDAYVWGNSGSSLPVSVEIKKLRGSDGSTIFFDYPGGSNPFRPFLESSNEIYQADFTSSGTTKIIRLDDVFNQVWSWSTSAIGSYDTGGNMYSWNVEASGVPAGDFVFARVSQEISEGWPLVKLNRSDGALVWAKFLPEEVVEVAGDVYGNVFAFTENKIYLFDADGNEVRSSTKAYLANPEGANFVPVHQLAVGVGSAGAELRRVSSSDVAGSTTRSMVRHKTAPDPATPPSGNCVVWFDGTALKVKFDDGTTTTIATK